MAQLALIIDDEPDIRELLQITLQRMKINSSLRRKPCYSKNIAIRISVRSMFDRYEVTRWKWC